MQQDFILALDQGTTSSRAMVFDRAGQIVARAQQEFRQIYPRPGWVEHDPVELLATQRHTAAEALRQASLAPGQVAGIGITNQRETVVVWDRHSGHPVHNAIVWQDRRTADTCRALKQEGREDHFNQKTGLFLDPYFSGTKLAWILDHVDGVRARAERGELLCGTIDCWLLWNLTGGRVHATEATNASRTLLYNIHTGDWDDELLGDLRIPRAMLPAVRSSSERFGEVSGDAALDGISVAGMAGDQQAALFGQTCFSPGMAKNTYGTGCFLLMPTGLEARPSRNKLLTTVAWRLHGVTEYALEGSVFIGGAVVQWLRDELRIIDSAPEVNDLAASVEDSGGVYLVPAFAGLGAPHWDPYARGTVMGLTRGSNRAHLARAALESIAFQSADLLHGLVEDAGVPVTELRVDGGAADSDLLMQFQADLLGVPVLRPKITETTALGAAYLAGLATGCWKDRHELAGHWQEARRFEPRISRDDAARHRRQWQRAVDRARNWIEEDPS